MTTPTNASESAGVWIDAIAAEEERCRAEDAPQFEALSEIAYHAAARCSCSYTDECLSRIGEIVERTATDVSLPRDPAASVHDDDCASQYDDTRDPNTTDVRCPCDCSASTPAAPQPERPPACTPGTVDLFGQDFADWWEAYTQGWANPETCRVPAGDAWKEAAKRAAPQPETDDVRLIEAWSHGHNAHDPRTERNETQNPDTNPDIVTGYSPESDGTAVSGHPRNETHTDKPDFVDVENYFGGTGYAG